MLSSTIDVLTHARDSKSDPFEALDKAIGWSRLLAAKPIAAELGRKADEDPLIKACERYMTVRRFAPKFLESFTFQASSNNDALLSALDLLKRLNREPHRPMSGKPPLSFLPKAWRRLVVKDGGVDRRLYEIASLAVFVADWLPATFGSKEPKIISSSIAISWRQPTSPKTQGCSVL